MSIQNMLWNGWLADYRDRAQRMLQAERIRSVCDLGCGDGSFFASILGPDQPGQVRCGIEHYALAARVARKTGLHVLEADLNSPLPYATDSFDAASSHFVIEHLVDAAMHLSEMFRILRPGGVAVVGTENLSSWHNVLALALGQQPFTMTIALHQEYRLGNKLQGGRMTKLGPDESPHVRVFAYQGLVDMLTVSGFTIEVMAGAGYFPLPARMGKVFARLTPRWAAFILAKVRKPR